MPGRPSVLTRRLRAEFLEHRRLLASTVVASFTGSLDGSTAIATSLHAVDGGNGGNADIRTGVTLIDDVGTQAVPVDPGDGSGGILSAPDHGVPSSVTYRLEGSRSPYYYRMVAPLDGGTLRLEISGAVEIHSQYLFAPTEIVGVFDGATPPSLIVHAGEPLFFHPNDESKTRERVHSAKLSLTPIGVERSIAGGNFTFWTTAAGDIAGSISANGGRGVRGTQISSEDLAGNGGDGGRVVLAANKLEKNAAGEYDNIAAVDMTASASGGNGTGALSWDTPSASKWRHGAKGGDGGAIMVSAGSIDRRLTADGGNGGDGYSGNADHPNGANGGAGGQGGRTMTRGIPGEFLVFASWGGAGGHGGYGFPGKDGTSSNPSGAPGGDGGAGGGGGGAGIWVSALESRLDEPVFGRGGRGGGAGSGGDGGEDYPSGQLAPGGRGGNGGDGGLSSSLALGGAGGAAGKNGNDQSGAPKNGESNRHGPKAALKATDRLPDESQIGNWTILYYGAGDDNQLDDPPVGNSYGAIEGGLIKKIDQLESVNLAGAGVKIAVQMDRKPDVPSPPTDGWSDVKVPQDAEWGNWTDTRRGLLISDTLRSSGVLVPGVHSVLTSRGERDTGDPNTLIDFIKWATEEAPAQHYALILNGHGGGVGLMLHDITKTSARSINLAGLRTAMSSPQTPKFDIVLLGPCGQQSVEVAVELAGKATFLVGATRNTYTLSLPVKAWIEKLKRNMQYAPEDLEKLAKLMSEEFGDETTSAIRVDAASNIATALDFFAQAVFQSATPADWNWLADQVASTPVVDEFQNYKRDMHTLFGKFGGSLNDDIRKAVQLVLTELDKLIVARKNAGGLSMHFPAPSESMKEEEYGVSRLVGTWRENGVEQPPLAPHLKELLYRIMNYGSFGAVKSPDRIVDVGASIGTSAVLLDSGARRAIALGDIEHGNDRDWYRVHLESDWIVEARAWADGLLRLGGSVYDGALKLVGYWYPSLSGRWYDLGGLTGPLAAGDYYFELRAGYPYDEDSNHGPYTYEIAVGPPSSFFRRIEVRGGGVDFGSFPTGVPREAVLEVVNSGTRSATITGIDFGPGAALASNSRNEPFPWTLEPGESRSYRVATYSSVGGSFSSTGQVLVRELDDPVSAFFRGTSLDNAWHNAIDQCDVNADERVTPLDALIVIDWLNSHGPGAIGAGPPPDSLKRDVDANGFVQPLDVLAVFDRLNSASRSPAAAPPSTAKSFPSATGSLPAIAAPAPFAGDSTVGSVEQLARPGMPETELRSELPAGFATNRVAESSAGQALRRGVGWQQIESVVDLISAEEWADWTTSWNEGS